MKQCINCGNEAKELHHVVPLSLGGNDVESNKVWLCSLCHAKLHGYNQSGRGLNWSRLQAEGIAKAKAEGKYKGRKRIEIDENKLFDLYQKQIKGEITVALITEELGISRQTYYRRIKLFKNRKV